MITLLSNIIQNAINSYPLTYILTIEDNEIIPLILNAFLKPCNQNFLIVKSNDDFDGTMWKSNLEPRERLITSLNEMNKKLEYSKQR